MDRTHPQDAQSVQTQSTQATRAVQVGVVLFVVGVTFIAIDVLPFYSAPTTGLWLNLALRGGARGIRAGRGGRRGARVEPSRTAARDLPVSSLLVEVACSGKSAASLTEDPRDAAS